MKRFLLLLFFFTHVTLALAQDKTVKGYVRDGETHEVIVGALVYGEYSSVSTNEYGFFSLVMPQSADSLKCEMPGFLSASVPVTDGIISIYLEHTDTIDASTVSAYSDASATSSMSGLLGLSSEKIRQIPSLLGERDVLKGALSLPGIEVGQDGSSGVMIRGGGADETLYLLDGMPVYNVTHMAGFLSVFDPGTVNSVSIYKSSFPAAYGGHTSGIVDIITNKGAHDGVHGEVCIGTVSDKLRISVPFNKGKTTLSASGRVMHTVFFTPILKLIGSEYGYYFYDLNAKLVHVFDDRNQLHVSGYLGKDKFSYVSVPEYSITQDVKKRETTRQTEIEYGNALLSAKWNHVYDNDSFSSLMLGYVGYSGFTESNIREVIQESQTGTVSRTFAFTDIFDLVAKFKYESALKYRFSIKAGADFTSHRYGNQMYSAASQIGGTPTDPPSIIPVWGHEAAVWADGFYAASDMFRLNAGLRLTGTGTAGDFYLYAEPRLSARLDISPALNTRFSYSRMTQYTHLLSSSDLSFPYDLWVPVGHGVKPMVSDQLSLGLYHSVKGWQSSVEVYWKWTQNVIDYLDGIAFSGNGFDVSNLVGSGFGRAYGMDLMVEKTGGPLSGWASLSLYRTERCYPGQDISSGTWFPSKYDRVFSFSVNANYKFNPKLDVSLNWTFYGGARFTAGESSVMQMDANGIWSKGLYVPYRNNYKLPPYHSLNLGLNYSWKKKKGTHVLNASVCNVYNARNPNLAWIDISNYADTPGHIRVSVLTYLPILPSLSYTFHF